MYIYNGNRTPWGGGVPSSSYWTNSTQRGGVYPPHRVKQKKTQQEGVYCTPPLVVLKKKRHGKGRCTVHLPFPCWTEKEWWGRVYPRHVEQKDTARRMYCTPLSPCWIEKKQWGGAYPPCHVENTGHLVVLNKKDTARGVHHSPFPLRRVEQKRNGEERCTLLVLLNMVRECTLLVVLRKINTARGVYSKYTTIHLPLLCQTEKERRGGVYSPCRVEQKRHGEGADTHPRRVEWKGYSEGHTLLAVPLYLLLTVRSEKKESNGHNLYARFLRCSPFIAVAIVVDRWGGVVSVAWTTTPSSQTCLISISTPYLELEHFLCIKIAPGCAIHPCSIGPKQCENIIIPLKACQLRFLHVLMRRALPCICYVLNTNFIYNIMLFLIKTAAWAQVWAGLELFRAEGLGSRFSKPEPSKVQPSPRLSGRARPAHH